MPPAARITDLHVCSAHGPSPLAAEGSPDVLVGGLPAAREADYAVCGLLQDPIVKGESTVLINGRMAARLGDPTEAGKITQGLPSVWIGLPPGADCLIDAADAGASFVEDVHA